MRERDQQGKGKTGGKEVLLLFGWDGTLGYSVGEVMQRVPVQSPPPGPPAAPSATFNKSQVDGGMVPGRAQKA